MKLHWGPPDHEGAIRFFQGTLKAKDMSTNHRCYFEHPIRSWFGISFRRSFFGVILTNPTRDTREPAGRAGGEA